MAGLAVLAAMTLTWTGCKEDTPTPKPNPNPPTPGGAKGDVAVVSMLTNPDGQSGTAWMQLVDGIAPRTIDNSKARQIGFGMPPMDVLGNYIFTIPQYGQSNTFTKWERTTGGALNKVAELELPVNSVSTHGRIYSAEKGFLSTMIGKLLIFNPTTMKLTGEIDLSSYADKGVSVPQFGSLFFDGETMYVPLWQVNTQRMPIGDPGIDLLLIDLKTNKVIKRIKDSASGLSSLGYPYGVQKNVFKDEQGDVYYVASGSFSTDPKYKTGIVRIKKGATEIDPTYNWVLNDQAIEGETGKMRWLACVHYAGNGKLYGMADMPNYWADKTKPNWLRDRSVISVEIDLRAKTVKKLPIPHSCAYSTHVSTYNDLIVFSVWGDKETGFYTYDPKTGKASDGAVIKMPGFPFWFYQFKRMIY